MNDLLCFRLLRVADKGVALSESIRQVIDGVPTSEVFSVDAQSLQLVPGAPFAYWVGNRVRCLFVSLSPFGHFDRSVKQGLATSDDFRFVRSSWEIPSVERDNRWFPMCKGGIFSPFYTNLCLLVNWSNEGAEIKAEVDKKYSHIEGYQTFWVVKNPEAYFLPGLTYPLRTARFSPQVMPAGTIISVRGSGIYCHEPLRFLALMNSKVFDQLLKTMLGWASRPQFDMGDINLTPVPNLNGPDGQRLEDLARRAWLLKRSLDIIDPISYAFECSLPSSSKSESLKAASASWGDRVIIVDSSVAEIQAEIDATAFRLYGLSEADLNADVSAVMTLESDNIDSSNGEDDPSRGALDSASFAASSVDYALGCAFGRWDIRFATGESRAPELPDPFAPLPVCPPGQLQNAQGLPARPEDVTTTYPVRIPWDGILVDDPNHPLDIERRVREVIEVVWKDRAEAIEHEACEILGVKSLRDYFRKPAGFFADHLKRYSKSRRQAPIYWPLSTASGSYTLWIYYHRLAENTLHTVLADFIDPKLKSLRDEISYLRNSGNQQARLEQLQDFEQELQEFRDEIERIIKLPWKPNLNDGVLITASPLWKLFRLPKWQKDLKACGEKLSKGDYDWAHLAYTIWPDRVKDVCKTDRSIAIAHGLEDLCDVEATEVKGKRKSKQRQGELA